MARPREFVFEKAVEDAMNVFWSGGYDESNLPDLLDGLKLSRGSFYKAFGNKRHLFIRSLLLYDETELQPGLGMLRNPGEGSGVSRIDRFFNGAIGRVEAGDRRGCLLCNAAVEVAPRDREIGDLVSRMFSDLVEGFSVALLDVNSQPALPGPENLAKAQALKLSYIGLRVSVRSGSDIEELKLSVASILRDL